MNAEHEPNAIWRTLREPNYWRYVTGNGLSLIGTWMQRIAIGWLTWELTHSPTWLGIIAMADFFPVVFMGPLGGALADRHSRVKVMVLSQLVAAACALSMFGLSLSGALHEWHLAIFTFISGMALGLNQASRLALAPSLVPRELLTTAIAINSMVFNSARFVGPMISTAVISLWAIHYSFLINAVSYSALIVALLSLNIKRRENRGKDGVSRSIIDDIREGVVFIKNHPPIRLVIVVMTMSALCLRPVVDLLPGLISDVFGKGADEFAILTASFGIGAILGGFWMARRGGMEDQPIVAMLGVIGSACAGVGLVATTSYAVALPFTIAAGFGMVVSGIGMQSTLQFVTPASMRGRVLSLYGVIHIGGAGIGAFILGLIAEVMGLRLPIVIAAVVGGIIWLTVWRKRSVIVESLKTKTAKP
ncbi:MAG: MFS transporter [Rhodospirillaceae bacterium]|jgi:MFS family permease|nr:MFS transporter [Rhodospirillaceae bacterium]